MSGNIKINVITKLINSLEDLDIPLNNISDSINEPNILDDLEKKKSSDSVIIDLEFSKIPFH